ncbi:MAG: O-antigen ligase family protein [Bacteroidota bacterium]
MTGEAAFKINRYLPFVVLYFFFNSLFLPEGLLFTTLLTPLFFFQIVREQKVQQLIALLAVLCICFILHYLQGIHLQLYLKSLLLFITVGIFAIWTQSFFNKVNSLDYIFKCILILNGAMLIVAVLALLTGVLKSQFWYLVPISPGLPEIPRLKMLTYEASYYSLLLCPIAFYAIWNFMIDKSRATFIYLLLALVPLLMSFSLGVLAGMIVTLICIVLIVFNWVKNNKRVRWMVIICSLLLLAVLIVLYQLYPDNPLVIRIKNIFTGKDTSARGRTYEAFDIALMVAKTKSIWLGVGLGQVKEIGRTLIIHYYNYSNIPEVVRIPNAVAETLAIYGFVGVAIRFIIEFVLFFKTKVYQNYYRLTIFIFIFIYQFTGSFIFNIAEYVLWALAFSTAFSQFDRAVLNKQKS